VVFGGGVYPTDYFNETWVLDLCLPLSAFSAPPPPFATAATLAVGAPAALAAPEAASGATSAHSGKGGDGGGGHSGEIGPGASGATGDKNVTLVASDGLTRVVASRALLAARCPFFASMLGSSGSSSSSSSSSSSGGGDGSAGFGDAGLGGGGGGSGGGGGGHCFAEASAAEVFLPEVPGPTLRLVVAYLTEGRLDTEALCRDAEAAAAADRAEDNDSEVDGEDGCLGGGEGAIEGFASDAEPQPPPGQEEHSPLLAAQSASASESGSGLASAAASKSASASASALGVKLPVGRLGADGYGSVQALLHVSGVWLLGHLGSLAERAVVEDLGGAVPLALALPLLAALCAPGSGRGGGSGERVDGGGGSGDGVGGGGDDGGGYYSGGGGIAVPAPLLKAHALRTLKQHARQRRRQQQTTKRIGEALRLDDQADELTSDDQADDHGIDGLCDLPDGLRREVLWHMRSLVI